MTRGFLVAALVVIAVGAALIFAAFQLSPWPATLLIRWNFDRGAVAASQALGKHVPAGVTALLDQRYGSDANELLDVFSPPRSPDDRALRPVVVWVHGGAWVSGDKSHIANYLRILASQGFVTVGIDYTIAPEARYPTPVRQVNQALAHLVAHAQQWGIDPDRIVLAGDSAGAQIAGQLSNAISSAAYAREMGLQPAIGRSQLRGVMFHSGAFDASSINADGAFGGFLDTVFWAYLGRRDFRSDPRVKQLSVTEHLGPGAPPVFVSAGNADPLAPQSYRLAELAAQRQLVVDTLFFPKDYQPPLGHEYQFDLDTAAGRLALQRTTAFIARVTAP